MSSPSPVLVADTKLPRAVKHVLDVLFELDSRLSIAEVSGEFRMSGFYPTRLQRFVLRFRVSIFEQFVPSIATHHA